MTTLPGLEEPEDHAVTGARDVSLHYEGGHSPRASHSGIGEHRAAEATKLSDQTLTEAEHVVVNYLPVDRGHLPRTINHEGRKR